MISLRGEKTKPVGDHLETAFRLDGRADHTNKKSAQDNNLLNTSGLPLVVMTTLISPSHPTYLAKHTASKKIRTVMAWSLGYPSCNSYVCRRLAGRTAGGCFQPGGGKGKLRGDSPLRSASVGDMVNDGALARRSHKHTCASTISKK